jgi:4-amino-4-deoxy-L-arabinose transferase-like glycosyltransferase
VSSVGPGKPRRGTGLVERGNGRPDAQPTERMPRIRRQAAPRPGGIRSAVAGIPTAALICALVALLNGVVWGVIVPLFQVPDEQAHVAYAQYLAETGRPPDGRMDRSAFSLEQQALLRALGWRQVTHRPDNRPLASSIAHRRLERASRLVQDSRGEGGYTHASGQPPLYYAAEAAVYRLSPSRQLPDRIHLMRLFSALLAAVTVLFVFLFLREALPATPWAWTVGALAVAFQPMFGFISGGVNDDNLLFAAAAGLFLAFAVAFRRGLTPWRGLAIGAAAAVAVLAKLSGLGLLPGVAIGLLLLVLSNSGKGRPAARGGAVVAVATVLVPLLIYMGLNTAVWDRGALVGNSGTVAVSETQQAKPPKQKPTPGSANLPDALSYLWQFYLPRLSFMEPDFNAYQAREVWLNGFVGTFGWVDYRFPGWVYDLAIPLALAILALAGRALAASWRTVRARAMELLTYLALAVGVVLFINVAGYFGRLDNPGGFEQARYLFPLLALYGALIALAARGAGRRWGPAVGILIVCIAIAHSAVAMLLTLTRYYG